MELIAVAQRLEDDDHVDDIASFHNEHNLGGVFDDITVRRLVAYALRSVSIQADDTRYDLHSVTELLDRPYATWTVRDLIPSTGLAVIYGGPGSGKTFLMLDMTMAIVRGIKWHGRRVKQGVVVYVAGEGALRGRVSAYLQHNSLTVDDLADFYALESSVNLLAQSGDVLDLIESIKAKVGDRPIRMIVVDTLARSMPGGNENASEDMGAVIGSAGKIAAAFQCVLAFVHHSGKDDTKGSRGHSSLKGACDVEISVRRDGEVRDAVAEKVRDGPDQSLLVSFCLRVVDLGAVSDHDPDAEESERITSCVISTDGLPERMKPEPPSKNQRDALTTIKATLTATGKRVLTADEAVRAVRNASGMPRNRAHEAIKGLIKNCYLKHSPMGGLELVGED